MTANRRAFLIGGSAALANCAPRPVEERGVDAVILSKEAAQLSQLRPQANVGSFFYVDDSRVALVLDLGAKLNANSTASWYVRAAVDADTEAWRIGSARFQSLGVFEQSVTVNVVASEKFTERIADPYLFLEVLNRPLTRELYNRTAEQRIVTWKASLAEAIARTATDGRGMIAMCTAIERLPSANYRLTSSRRISDLEAATITQATDAALGVPRSSHPDLKSRPVFVAALFQRVSMLSSSEAPTIQFALAGGTSIALGRVSES